jgi:O-antigen/teichoic acid export membrane protein
MRDAVKDGKANDSRRALWAIADQCSVSAGNFLTNLILLRVMLPVDFGTYALILNAIIFFGTIQQALVTYPLCVRGARARDGQFRRLAGFALFAAGLLTVVLLGPILFAVGFSLNRPAVVLTAILAMFFWQMQEAMRSAFIARLEQRRALLGDALSYLGQAVFLGAVSYRMRPSLGLVFGTIAGTSFVALAIQIYQIGPALPSRRILRPLAWEFWSLGRWNMVAKLLGFLTLQAFPWLILMRHGKVQVAGFQAVFQLLAFTNPLLFSIASLITATVARVGGYKNSMVRNYLLMTSGLVGTYLLALIVAGPGVMRLLYGSHSHYLEFATLTRVFAVAWVFEMISQFGVAILGGLRQPRGLFLQQMAGAIVAVLVALPLAYFQGVFAVGYGLLAINIVRAATGIVLILRHKGDGGGGRGMPVTEETQGVVVT